MNMQYAAQRLASPNHPLKEPEINYKSGNGFMHPGILGKSYSLVPGK
jgi:hypothetical protein